MQCKKLFSVTHSKVGKGFCYDVFFVKAEVGLTRSAHGYESPAAKSIGRDDVMFSADICLGTSTMTNRTTRLSQLALANLLARKLGRESNEAT